MYQKQDYNYRKRQLIELPFHLEVTPGFEPGNEGFAALCLTAWPRYRMK